MIFLGVDKDKIDGKDRIIEKQMGDEGIRRDELNQSFKYFNIIISINVHTYSLTIIMMLRKGHII